MCENTYNFVSAQACTVGQREDTVGCCIMLTAVPVQLSCVAIVPKANLARCTVSSSTKNNRGPRPRCPCPQRALGGRSGALWCRLASRGRRSAHERIGRQRGSPATSGTSSHVLSTSNSSVCNLCPLAPRTRRLTVALSHPYSSLYLARGCGWSGGWGWVRGRGGAPPRPS